MQCSHWSNGPTYRNAKRCQRLAVVRLIQPDGRLNPGGWHCQHHADAVITEYRDKLGEVWTTQPVDQD